MPKCPDCRKEIPPDDFNVATDIAYCRRCGRTHTFSRLAARDQGKRLLSQGVPGPIRIEESLYGGTTLRYRKVSPSVWFFIFFTAIWSGGSMTGMVLLLREKGFVAEVFFFLPFLLGTVGLVCAIAFMLFGRTEITRDGDAFTVFTGVGSIGRRRSFHAGADKTVSVVPGNTRINGRPLNRIEIALEDGGRVCFGSLITPECQEYIAAWLMTEG